MDWAAGGPQHQSNTSDRINSDLEDLETRSCLSTRTNNAGSRRWREVEYNTMNTMNNENHTNSLRSNHNNNMLSSSSSSNASNTADTPRNNSNNQQQQTVLPPERSGASCVYYDNALWLYAGYGGGNGRLDDLYRFDLQRRQWSKIQYQSPKKPMARENNSAIVINHKMYLFGGYSGFTWLNDFWSFDFKRKCWEIVPGSQNGSNVPCMRFGFVAGAYDNTYFLWGGYDGSRWLNDCYEFDLNQGQQQGEGFNCNSLNSNTTLSSQTQTQSQQQSATNPNLPGWIRTQYGQYYNGLGGGTLGFNQQGGDSSSLSHSQSGQGTPESQGVNNQNTNDFDHGGSELVNVSNNNTTVQQAQTHVLPQQQLTSSALNSLNSTNQNVQYQCPSGRSCPAFATHQDSIWLFGGYDGLHRLSDLHQFRMPTRTWTAIKPTGGSSSAPSPRYFHSAVVYGDSLFILGGYSGSDRLNDLYEFRIDINTWFVVQAEDPLSGRSSFAAVVASNSLYVFGGYNGSRVLNDFHEFKFDPVSIPPSQLVNDLRSLVNNPQLSDVCFLLEGNQRLYATKAHLAARSEHFRALFYGGLRESLNSNTINGQLEPIPIGDCSYETFLLLLLYLYTDTIPPHTSMGVQTAVELLISAERYLLRRLKALCEDNLRRMLDFENCIGILLTAKKHNASGLKEICMDFLLTHEQKMKTLSSFKDLTEEPILLYELLMRRKAINAEGVTQMGSMSPISGSHATPEQSPQHTCAQPRSSLIENFNGLLSGVGKQR